MTLQLEESRVPRELLPEFDEYVDDAVAYACGELSPEQEGDFRARMQQDADYRAVVGPVVRSYVEPPLNEEEMAIAWPNFVRAAGWPESVAQAGIGGPAEQERRGRVRLLKKVGLVAAGLALLVGLNAANVSIRKALAYDTVETSQGGTLTKLLPDGTIATLGPESELRYPLVMLTDVSHPLRKRSISTKGRVTFEVPTVAKPAGSTRGTDLMIETPHAMIQVVGTKLTVTSNEHFTSIEVLEGTVMVRRLPTPGERLTFTTPIFLKAPASAKFTFEGYETATVRSAP